MGQYHTVVNLDKREKIEPHPMGSGAKLIEQMHDPTGPGIALLPLLACSAGRGGGDCFIDDEGRTHSFTSSDYRHDDGADLIEGGIVGRWAGDRIAVIGDYAEKDDLPNDDAQALYNDEGLLDISGALAAYLKRQISS